MPRVQARKSVRLLHVRARTRARAHTHTHTHNRRVPYSVEVLKGGSIVETRNVAEKGHYTFGRTPVCDFILEHPSASRLHAVGIGCGLSDL